MMIEPTSDIFLTRKEISILKKAKKHIISEIPPGCDTLLHQNLLIPVQKIGPGGFSLSTGEYKISQRGKSWLSHRRSKFREILSFVAVMATLALTIAEHLA